MKEHERESVRKGTPEHLLFDIDEPGYYAAMKNAFEQMKLSMNQPFSLDLVILPTRLRCRQSTTRWKSRSPKGSKYDYAYIWASLQ